MRIPATCIFTSSLCWVRVVAQPHSQRLPTAHPPFFFPTLCSSSSHLPEHQPSGPGSAKVTNWGQHRPRQKKGQGYQQVQPSWLEDSFCRKEKASYWLLIHRISLSKSPTTQTLLPFVKYLNSPVSRILLLLTPELSTSLPTSSIVTYWLRQ